MVLGIPNLVPELQEKIYSYCTTSDLLNVACCNKNYYFTVIHLLWHVLKTEWKFLENKASVKKRTKHLKFTAILHIKDVGASSNDYANNSSKKKDECRASCYKHILKQCSPQRLHSLQLDGFLPKNGLELASVRLSGLIELNLSNIFFADWEYICNCKNLQKLSLQNSNITDVSLQQICNLQNLKEIVVVQCLELTKVSLQYVSNLVKITKMTFSYDWSFISTDDYIHNLGKLVNLTYLSLEFTGINDKLFSDIRFNLRNLVELNVSWCHHLTDSCMIYISQLVVLQKLNISRCTRITDEGLSYLSNLKLLNCFNISGCTNITDKGLLCLASVASLREVDASFCSNISYEGMLALKKSCPSPILLVK